MYPLSTLLGRNKSSMQGTQSICGLHSTLCGIHRQDWQGLREGGASRVLSMISKFKGLEEKGTCCAKYPLNTRNGIRAVDRRADLRLRQEGKGGRLGTRRDTQASSSAQEEQFWATKVKSSTTGKHSWLHQKVPLHAASLSACIIAKGAFVGFVFSVTTHVNLETAACNTTIIANITFVWALPCVC